MATDAPNGTNEEVDGEGEDDEGDEGDDLWRACPIEACEGGLEFLGATNPPDDEPVPAGQVDERSSTCHFICSICNQRFDVEVFTHLGHQALIDVVNDDGACVQVPADKWNARPREPPSDEQPPP